MKPVRVTAPPGASGWGEGKRRRAAILFSRQLSSVGGSYHGVTVQQGERCSTTPPALPATGLSHLCYSCTVNKHLL